MTNKQAAIEIINRLRRSGYQALLAGGCVRDMLLGRRASDYDVATDAGPQNVIKLFKRTVKVGVKFGVVIVLTGDQQVEVATFRTESGYQDGRHPSSVTFSGPAEDASRRDFTINAMFYDTVWRKVIDYFDGQADLKKRLIRTVGQPRQRFGEDYLRMLRAVRFAAELSFEIEDETFSAICANAENITRISGERIQIELERMLTNPNRAAGAGLLVDSGLSEALFPGLSGVKMGFAVDVPGNLKRSVDFPLALAGFFSGCETKFAMEKCTVLKLSRAVTRHVKFLLEKRDYLLDKNMSLSQLRLIVAEPYFGDLFELQRAVEKARGRTLNPLRCLQRRIRDLGDVELKPRPVLNGHDLMKLGAPTGPVLGQLAEEMYIAQLEGTLKTAEQAEKWVRKWLEKHRKLED